MQPSRDLSSSQVEKHRSEGEQLVCGCEIMTMSTDCFGCTLHVSSQPSKLLTSKSHREFCIPPYLSDRSQTRCPQMPEVATTMVSPGSRQLAMVASMPACPVPLTCKTRKENITPFNVNSTRSLVIFKRKDYPLGIDLKRSRVIYQRKDYTFGSIWREA